MVAKKRSSSLAEYHERRDFSITAEPEGDTGAADGNRFLVQKHDATRLHYDLRLEMDGVLKSWAVTRGPSADPADRRLAVRTEDHPLAYGDFEGSIPEKQYGAGTVMLWDTGTWEPVAGKSASLDEGKLHFIVHGERMKGEWLLVRMKGKPGDKRENWLLRKIDDAHAVGSDELTGRYLTSVTSGRTMKDIADGRDPLQPQPRKRRARDQRLPGFRKPQLATLADTVPTGSDWLHEIKYDGYRCLIAAAGSKVRIDTRSGKHWTDRFPDIAEAFAELDLPTCLIDGEIVKLDADGNPDFSLLQTALKNPAPGLTLFAFDLLMLAGEDLTGMSTLERKQRLAGLLPQDHEKLRVADHLIGAGEKLLDAMCKAGQEGIICKRADAAYQSGRTRDWLKVKCTRRQEFVIIGWRSSKKKGRAFASLLLGQYRDGDLVYQGRVGTGFSEQDMEDLSTRFRSLSRKTAPAAVPASDARDAHWVTPKLVAEIAFAEFTSDGKVRHGSFVGLRSDKPARQVAPEKVATDTSDSTITISSRDRLLFPKAGATKGDLADYYSAVAPLMLPWIARRPISLVRCPKGREKHCFFQKHNPGSFGKAVRSLAITEKSGDVEDYLYVEKPDGVLACVQMGTIEFHGWGARNETLEQPDRLVFDLDPDEGLSFADVKKAAEHIRQELAAIGLVSFAMLSGGKGIHVVVPLTPEARWPAVKDFAKRFARALSMARPDRYTATMSKKARKGRLFIDWLRNQRGSTSVLPYSVRAREGAPVAAPVSWQELAEIDTPAAFTIQAVDTLLTRASSEDLRQWGIAAQVLPDV